jgi:hypothetical protein
MRYRRNENTSSHHLVCSCHLLAVENRHCNTYFSYIVLAVCEIGLLRHLGFLQLVGWPYTRLDHYKLSMPHFHFH